MLPDGAHGLFVLLDDLRAAPLVDLARERTANALAHLGDDLVDVVLERAAAPGGERDRRRLARVGKVADVAPIWGGRPPAGGALDFFVRVRAPARARRTADEDVVAAVLDR